MDITEQLELQIALRKTTEDLRQRSVDLQAARDRAVLAAKATTGFLATVSHDIRQPLQAMALQLGGLGNEVSTPEGKRQLLALERSLGSAMELLDLLLEYVKLDAGALNPHVTTVSIGSLLAMLNDTFAVVAAQRRIRLSLCPIALGTRSDPQLLGRILRNFVSNAIKYTDRGGVLVGCRRRGDSVRIEVWDTGCGIPTEHHRQIFWEFVQIKEAGRQQGGLDSVWQSSTASPSCSDIVSRFVLGPDEDRYFRSRCPWLARRPLRRVRLSRHPLNPWLRS